MYSLATVEELQTLLESASTAEGRLVISGIVIVAAILLGGVITPYVVRRLKRLLFERFITGTYRDRLEQASQYASIGLSLVHLIRVVQLFIGFLAGVALLVVWGLTGLAGNAISLLSDGIDPMVKVGLTIGLILLTYIAIGFEKEFIARLAGEENRLDDHQAEVLLRVAQVCTIIAIGVIALGLWVQEIGGLLVGAGFLGIVVGMAARQTLGSVIAGFVLMLSRPFEIGDWIEVSDHEGIVTDITVVNTRIENFDGEYVVIPNDVVSNEMVINRTRKGRLRLRVEVGIDYAADPALAEEVAMETMTNLDEVMPVPRPQVIPTRFDDSAVILELRFWIDNPSSRRRWRATAAVIRGVHESFATVGVKIPYPQRELSGREETGGFRLAGTEQRMRSEVGAETETPRD